ncbi:MAG TPA: cytochrome c biogenesis protein DipZ [Actinomycetota bacterium]|nr:cytochrome c biogenesis protein DipZ [Actinomycetota bacterium]
MIYLVLVAFIGGAVSALTPCVLPILPALLAVSGGQGRRRVIGIVVGLELSFFLLAIVLAAILSSLGLSNSLLQWVAAALLVAFGLTLIVPSLNERFQSFVSRVTGPLATAVPRKSGFAGGLLAGAPLGLIWAPCAGPILAGITVAGASMRFGGRTIVMMVAYALGMLGPLLLIAIGGRRASDFLRKRFGSGRRVEFGMGIILILTAAMVGFGWANQINRFLAEWVNLTSTPTAALEEGALRRGGGLEAPEGTRVRLTDSQLVAAGYPELQELADYGPAPDVKGISNWFNDEPLSIKELRGKVVLVDFWTYSCINCIRTFPYLKQWYADYRDDGLVILGVHTPEFTFEKDPDNVSEAIDDFGIEYPVALDPNYETWNQYYNRYWPAHYLIDRDGTLRSVHYGEGAYERTENEIRHLLSLPETAEVEEEEPSFTPRTPETYLGYARADRFASAGGLVPDEEARYEAPAELPTDWWAYSGTWTVTGQAAVAGPDASIALHFRAREVHMVAGPTGSSSGTITVRTAGEERTIEADEHRLYTLRTVGYEDAVMDIEVSEGVEVYSFTFG